MPNPLTVTAKAGPGIQNTAIVLNNVNSIEFDFNRKMIFVTRNGLTTTQEYDMTGITSVSFSISGSTYSMTIS